jgi:hypothetical protein
MGSSPIGFRIFRLTLIYLLHLADISFGMALAYVGREADSQATPRSLGRLVVGIALDHLDCVKGAFRWSARTPRPPLIGKLRRLAKVA